MSLTRLKIATIVEIISNVQDQRTLVNDCIQIALNRVFEYFDYPYYIQEGNIQTVATYSTGTVNVTNGLTSVTGTLTVWTTSMVGRKIRFGNENAYYRITAVGGAGSLTLDQAYQGTTNTANTYTIYKDEYRLASDVDKYKVIRQMQNAIPLASMEPTRFDRVFPMPNSYADPIYEIMTGTKLDTYSTGTVSATVNTNTITGSGTSWTSVEGLGRMSNIRISNDVYTVKSVDSDTQITIYENISTAASGGSYIITLDNLVVQLYQIPNSQRNLRYRYFRLPTILANDYDLPDMPHSWHHLLTWGALSEIESHKGDINKSENVYEQRFLLGLERMKLKIGSFAPDRIYQIKSQDRYQRGITDGLEASSYDRWYSSPY